MLTRDDVIRARQNELVNEVFDIERRIEELTSELEKLNHLKEQRIIEHRLLEELGERSILGDSVGNRKVSRISFEDCLIKVYDQIGRPLKIGELIEELGKFGYQWSNYWKAYSYITNSDILESTGARGYYNVVRSRGR